MSDTDVLDLRALGWNGAHAAAFEPFAAAGLVPARVTTEHRGKYMVATAVGDRSARVSGRFRHLTHRSADFPTVGDWLAAEMDPRKGPESAARIHAVLPRQSVFSRGGGTGTSTGRGTEEQVVAANVDVVFLVSALDHDLNLRRIERYLALAWASGAEPVIILNKADLHPDVEAATALVADVAGSVPIRVVSARAGDGLDGLREWLGFGRTGAFLGSSGVGKSTIVNGLLGEDRQATAEVRLDDSRGRHTTSHRQLLPLPGGGLLVDTPGMRSIELFDAVEGLDRAFADIDEIAAGCKFADCAHGGEPDCAVERALADGTLGADRFASYRKLEREAQSTARRDDPVARAAERRRWRAITTSVDRHMKSKYGEGTRRS